MNKRVCFLLYLLSTFSPLSNAQVIWSGTVNSDWTNPANWQGGVVPGAADAVVIPDEANDPVIQNGVLAVAKSVAVDPGAAWTVQTGGSITMDGSIPYAYAIFNEGLLKNYGLINIGSGSNSEYLGGIRNHYSGILENLGGGEIKVDRSHTGIINSNVLENAGTITIAPVLGVTIGIQNFDQFNNLQNAKIHILRASSIGLESKSQFTNAGLLKVGTNGFTGQEGIYNTAYFTNNEHGEIEINGFNVYAIDNEIGEMYNSGLLKLGTISNVGFDGIYSRIFINQEQGKVYISNCQRGIDVVELFDNYGSISIGQQGQVTTAILNDGGDFLNQGCSSIQIFSNSNIISNVTFTNYGRIVERSTGSSHIQANHGIIQNLNGGTFSIDVGNPPFTDEGAIWYPCNNGDWSDGLNWTGNATPTANDHAIIPDMPHDPVISTGTLAFAKSVWVKPSASLTLNTGAQLEINGGTQFGMSNFGIVDNQGVINIGNTNSVGPYGLKNDGSFNNLAGGELNIDRSTGVGIDNSPGGALTNFGQINLGSNASIGTFGIENKQWIYNKPGGEIQVDRTSNTAIKNLALDGGIINEGNIVIGSVALVGANGLVNYGIFENKPTGNLLIDRSTTAACTMYTGSEFINSGLMRLGSTASIGLYGILSSATVTQNSGAFVYVDRFSKYGILSSNGVFNNSGTISIGGIAGGETGIRSQNNFNNFADGHITINRCTLEALYNLIGAFYNYGMIVLGNEASPGKKGIWNKNTFFNQGGNIHIDNCTEQHIFNETGTFSNTGSMIIGAIGASGFSGITNNAAFNNYNYAEVNYVGISNQATFYNGGELRVRGAANALGWGVANHDWFQNGSEGEIFIDFVNNVGLQNYSGLFENEGLIKIGSQGMIEEACIRNIGTFDNSEGASIQLDNAGVRGFWNYPGTFNNSGEVAIGTNNSAGIEGFANFGLFENGPSGELFVDRSDNYELVNSFGGELKNYGNIVLGQTANNAQASIRNDNSIFNYSCGQLHTFGSLNNTASISNEGWMTTVTLDPHSNAALLNQGVIEYPLGNPIPNVTNLDLVLSPISTQCTTVINALQIGNDNDFTVGSTWYLDENLSTIAGEYNQATNTFTITNLAEGATYTLYFQVTDDLYGCAKIVAIKLRYDDTQEPEALCQDISVEIQSNETATITPGMIDNGSIDNCTAVTLSLDVTEFTCDQLGENEVILTVMDEHGLSNNCSALVTVTDPNAYCCAAPVALCKPATIHLDASGNGMINIADVDNGSTYECGLNTINISPTTVDCSDVGTPVTVTLTVTDLNDASDFCTSIVTVVDQVLPNAQCQNVTVNLDAVGEGSATASAVNNGSNDACGIESLSLNLSSFNCAHVGANTIVLTVTDNNNNANTCSAIVTVVDQVLPNAQCQNVTVNLDTVGEGSTTASAVNNGSSDACGVASMSLNQSAFTCAQVGANTVVLTVTDNNNNVNTCSAVVTVLDPLPPVIQCKSTISIGLNANGVASLLPADILISSTDNCGVVNLSVTPNLFYCNNLGPNSVTLTANDGHENTTACQATAWVKDAILPTMLCRPANISLNTNGLAVLSVAQVNNGSYDNCGIVSYNLSQTTFNCSHVGVNQVVLGGTDQSGNVGLCSAVVTVNDLILPVARCKNALVNLNSNGQLNLNPTVINNNSSDNCSFSLSVIPNSFNCSNIGANTVILRATDGSNNSATCTAIVTIRDNSAPNALCKNATVILNATGQGNLTVEEVNNGTTDACGIASMALNQTQFNCSDLGSSNVVVLTVKDIYNNTATCTAQITVADYTTPIAVCSNTVVTLGQNGLVAVYTAPLAHNSVDNCSIWSYSPAVKVYTPAHLGDNNLLITVKDWSGNAAICSSVVTVLPYSGNTDFQDEVDEWMIDEIGTLPAAREVPQDSIQHLALPMLVYPNPTEGETFVEFEMSEEQWIDYQVFDNYGRLARQGRVPGATGINQIRFDMTDFTPGFYWIVIKAGKMAGRMVLTVVKG